MSDSQNRLKSASSMLDRFGFFLRWVAKRFFLRAMPSPESVRKLQDLASRGQIVYIQRTRSRLDYLFFNALFLRHQLPLARFANDLNLGIFRGFRAWVKDSWRRFTQKIKPEGPDDLALALQPLENAALLFMRRDRDTASDPAYFEKLIELQRSSERPLFLVPALIVWQRDPAKGESAFGELESSRGLSGIWNFWRHYKQATVQFGDAIDLQAAMRDHEGVPDKRLASKLRRTLFVHLGHEALAIRGPALKPTAVLHQEILQSASFQHELIDAARAEGVPPSKAYERAERYLKEITSAWSYGIVRFLVRLLDIVFERVFSGVEINAAGLQRLREAAKQIRSAPLILVPSHKSHVDYLVISWAFLRNQFVPPHVAAGANLSFFPVGWFLRRGGAFFIRRTFSGLPLYKYVFRHYLWKLVREGYPIEFFIEGGRSRTGKLLPPKLGLLSMLLEGARLGEYRDLQFVPINLSYERVVETGSYKHELEGGEKKPESVGGVVKASSVFRSRYGRIYVDFGEPVRLSDWVEQKIGRTIHGVDESTYRNLTSGMGDALMSRIASVAVVTPSSLVATILLCHHQRGVSEQKLCERAGFLVASFQARGARLSRSIEHCLELRCRSIEQRQAESMIEGYRSRGEALRALLDEALILLKRGIEKIEIRGEAYYRVPAKSRIEMDYYRNQLLGLLAEDALCAVALLSIGSNHQKSEVLQATATLIKLFTREFVFFAAEKCEVIAEKALARLEADGVISFVGDCVAIERALTLDFYRRTVAHLFEGYAVCALALSGIEAHPLTNDAFINVAREEARSLLLEGSITCSEAGSTVLLKNALAQFVDEKLVLKTKEKMGLRSVDVYRLTPGQTAETLTARAVELQAWLRDGEAVSRITEEIEVAQVVRVSPETPTLSLKVPVANPPEKENAHDSTGHLERGDAPRT